MWWRRLRPLAPWLAGWVAGGWASDRSAAADESFSFGAHDVRSAFFIARSQNKNQVHYAVHLDAACAPVGSEPAYGYWRMLEDRGQIEPILSLETPAYGLARMQEVSRQVDGVRIRVRLRAFPDRPLQISVRRMERDCQAEATVAIAGVEARLHFIYVKLKWPLGIDFVLLRGSALLDDRVVEERLQM